MRPQSILENHIFLIKRKGIHEARKFLYSFYPEHIAFEVEKQWFIQHLLAPKPKPE